MPPFSAFAPAQRMSAADQLDWRGSGDAVVDRHMDHVRGELSTEGGRVVLRTDTGRVPLSAADIYALVTHGRSTHVELARPAAETAPGVVFMSRPLAVFIWARNAAGAELEVDAAVTVRGQPEVLRELVNDHVLSGDVWHPLDAESLGAAKDWLQRRGAAGTSLAAYANIYRGLNSSVRIQDDVDMDQLRSAAPPGETPRGLRATLYPYQAVGYRWLSEAVEAGLGCLLADEMGLGKTVQVIALLEERCSRQMGPSLVLAPVTLLENWRRELHRFAPALRVNVHHGPSRARYGGAFNAVDVVLVSYDTAARDVGVFLARDWDLLIMDEAQNVKNPDTLRAQLLRQLPRRAAVMMTGTPIENATMDLWSLADFAVPGYMGTREHFIASLAEQPELLARAVRPLLLRREVADVATDLPERVDADVAIDMFDGESAGYEELISSMQGHANRGNALALITRLRQYTAHPSLVSDLAPEDPIAMSAKLARLTEMLREIFAANNKVLIFSAFRAMSDLISRVIQERMYVPSWVMDGRTPASSRQQIVDTFSGHDGAAALVLHPATGGTGLNITAANHVIHYTLEWNPAKESQATARSFRRGQELPVFVHRLLYPDTIDEVIADVLRQKRDLADEVIGPSDALGLDVLVRALGGRRVKAPPPGRERDS